MLKYSSGIRIHNSVYCAYHNGRNRCSCPVRQEGDILAEKRNIYTIYDDNTLGTVQISDDVLAVISALAATEPEGIASIRDGLSGDQISRSGMKALAKSVKVTVDEGRITVHLVLNMKYGYNIPDTTKQVQEKVKDTLENMTGLEVKAVHVSIADVQTQTIKKSRAK